MEDPTYAAGAHHLCVLVHGLWGTPDHLANVAAALRNKHAEDRLHILVAKRNSGNFTYDGIECGGERVCYEIEEEIEKLEKQGQKIEKLSIVGYSLGGLVARYAIGLLYSRGLFDTVEPINFTTFASPHLGVRTPIRGWRGRLWNVFGAHTLSMSGRQLFLIDNFRDTERHLIEILADRGSIFIKGLMLFKRRTLYANVVNDRSAVYYTTYISETDPFADLGKVKINYLKGYDDVVLDPSDPYTSAEPKSQGSSSLYQRLKTQTRAFLNGVPLTATMAVFVPVGAVFYLVNSAIQSVNSSRRIRLHETGKAGIEVSGYRIPLLISGMGEVIESAYENLNSAQGNDYISSQGEEGTLYGTIQNRTREKLASSSTDPTRSSNVTPASKQRSVDIPTLALAPEQFTMIDSLDQVGWRKYPIHIHKVDHSHAAIIVRYNRPGLVEGYTVMRHWLDEEFLME